MSNIRLRAVEAFKNDLLSEGKSDEEIVKALDRFIMPKKDLQRVHKMEEELDILFNSDVYINMQKEQERISPLNRENDKKLVEMSLTPHFYYKGGITFPDDIPEEAKSFSVIWSMISDEKDRDELIGLAKELSHLSGEESDSAK